MPASARHSTSPHPPRRRQPQHLSRSSLQSPSPAVDDIPSAYVSRGAPAHNSLQGRRLRDALAGLDACNASDVLRQPCATFRTPPAFIKGLLRQAMQFALSQIQAAHDPLSMEAERAWKLWICLPRMLLCRPAAASRIPKPELRARFDKFFRGNWQELLQQAETSSGPRSRPPDSPNPEARINRAIHLAHLGELSAARQAILASPLAPGDEATLAQLGTQPGGLPSLMRHSAHLSWSGLRLQLLHWPPKLSLPTCAAPDAEPLPVRLDTLPKSSACCSTTHLQQSPCMRWRSALPVQSSHPAPRSRSAWAAW